MTSQSDISSNSLFPVGSHNLITGGSFVQKNNTFVQNFDVTKALKPLYNKVSPNAILNKGGRADAVRCYPGTREEVIGRIEKWHRAHYPEGHPIFWLSRPAGAGKSAIMQTIAERCIERDIPMVNFFFFRADGSRNHSEPVVSTLLFQLFELFPALKAHVTDIATNNPVIFRQSVEDQFSILIEKPLRAIREISGQGPPILLIDGLDECSAKDGKAEQTALLRILHNMGTKADPMFRVLVASRTEAHLTMTFNKIGASPDSIYLDESYRPFDDIRLFLAGEFSSIRETHHLRDTLDGNWPLPADIDTIAHKSSGQFVYVATVMRFIATSPASPKHSLEIVLGLRPMTKTSPFATLDALYTHILSQAEDWKSVHDILAAHKVRTDVGRYLTLILSYLDYTEDDIVSALSDLTSILRFKPGDKDLTVFHASLLDFLYDSSRAGMLYIDVNPFACNIVPLVFKQATVIAVGFDYLNAVTKPDEVLNNFLISFIPHPGEVQGIRGYPNSAKDDWIQALDKLYQPRDPLLYGNIRNHWQQLLFPVENTTQESSECIHVMERDTQEETPTPLVSRPATPSSRWLPKFWLGKNRKT